MPQDTAKIPQKKEALFGDVFEKILREITRTARRLEKARTQQLKTKQPKP